MRLLRPLIPPKRCSPFRQTRAEVTLVAAYADLNWSAGGLMLAYAVEALPAPRSCVLPSLPAALRMSKKEAAYQDPLRPSP